MKLTSMISCLTFAICCAGLIACTSDKKFDVEKEKTILLKLDAQMRENHFSKNARGMSEGFSPDFIELNRGKMGHRSEEQAFERFEKYFNSVDFIKWDNNQDPVVRFSDDGSVAYMMVDKEVIVKQLEDGVIDTTVFTWMSVFKKVNGKWILDAVASTNN